MDAVDLIFIPLTKALIVFVGLVLWVPFSVIVERKIIGRIQERPGPNRVGVYGILRDLTGRTDKTKPIRYLPMPKWRNGELQALIDGLKLLLKEDHIPPGAEKPAFMFAPVIAVVVAFITFSIVPLGPAIENVELWGWMLSIAGWLTGWMGFEVGRHARTITMGIADLETGILIYFALTSVAVYGIVLAGWASNSKYALLGGIRSAAQLVSYELTLGLSLIGVLLITGSFNMRDLVAGQSGGFWTWNVFAQPLGFALFLVGGFAETNRLPFDLPEGESELGAGFHTEYSSLRFALFFMAEYVNILTFSAILASLFLGGYHGPFSIEGLPPFVAAASGLLWFFVKVMMIFFFFVWVRGTLPRLRYDQLMDLGWKIMFPLAVANVMVTAGVLALVADPMMRGLTLFGAGVAIIILLDRMATAKKMRMVRHAS